MGDDIVTRLRAEGEWMPDGGGGKYWDENDVCQEAADEIERLRNALTHLGEYVSELETERNELEELVRRNAHP